jgi:sugar phosphate permease
MWGLLYAFIGCLGIFYGVTFPIYGLCAGDYFPQEAIGTVIGAWTPFYGSGAIIAHWVTGILRDKTGVYDQAFMIFIITAAAGVLLMCMVRRS